MQGSMIDLREVFGTAAVDNTLRCHHGRTDVR